MTFFQSRNPGIEPRQSRDFGIGKVGRDPGIAIPNRVIAVKLIAASFLIGRNDSHYKNYYD